MLDFCVGLDTEFSEVVEGSHLYFPKTKFEHVCIGWHTDAYIHTRTHIYTHTHACTHIHTNMRAHTHKHTCTHTCKHTYIMIQHTYIHAMYKHTIAHSCTLTGMLVISGRTEQGPEAVDLWHSQQLRCLQEMSQEARDGWYDHIWCWDGASVLRATWNRQNHDG